MTLHLGRSKPWVARDEMRYCASGRQRNGAARDLRKMYVVKYGNCVVFGFPSKGNFRRAFCRRSVAPSQLRSIASDPTLFTENIMIARPKSCLKHFWGYVDLK